MQKKLDGMLDDIRRFCGETKTILDAIKEYFALKNKMLLTLSSDWTSGTRTVPNVSKYLTIEVYPYATLGGVICRLEPDGTYRGSGFVQGASSQFALFEYNFSISGNALTIKQCRFGGFGASGIWDPETAFIRRIKGIEPKLPTALQNLIGGVLCKAKRGWHLC